jgi:putative chitobiose transport system substrate-binding protein
MLRIPTVLLPRRQFLASSVAFTLGACAASTTSSGGSGPQRLTFWTMQLKPTFDVYVTNLISAFQKQHPGAQVEWVDVPWGEMENKVLTAIAANAGPDVVNLNPQFASKLAEKQALANLGALVGETAQAEYFPNFWKANQLGDTTFGVPWYVATDVTVYNRDRFQQAKLDPTKPPLTYTELAAQAKAIAAATGKPAFLPTLDGSQVLESMVQMGVTLLTPERQAGFDTEAGRAAFEYWVSLFQQNIIPREVLTESHRRAIELYQAGELALLMTGSQLLRQVAENAPDIAEKSEVSSQIAGPSGVKSASVMNVAVPSRSGQTDLAVQFALFLTNSQNQLAFAKQANVLPSTPTSVNDPYFTAGAKSLVDKARLVSAQQLPQAEVLIPPVEGLEELRKVVYEELQLAMLEEKSVEQAVTTAAQRWNEMA